MSRPCPIHPCLAQDPIDTTASVQTLRGSPSPAAESIRDEDARLPRRGLRVSYLTCQHGNDMFFHLLRRKWLANVPPGATRESLYHVRLAAFGGNHHDRNIFRTLNAGKLFYELNTIH